MTEVTYKVLSHKRYRCLHPKCKGRKPIKQAHLDGHRNMHKKSRQQVDPAELGGKTPPAEPLIRSAQRNMYGEFYCPYCGTRNFPLWFRNNTTIYCQSSFCKKMVIVTGP